MIDDPKQLVDECGVIAQDLINYLKANKVSPAHSAVAMAIAIAYILDTQLNSGANRDDVFKLITKAISVSMETGTVQ
jgi:hypothetical protein